MTARSALAGLATGVALAAALGSPPAQHAADDARNLGLGHTLTAFPSWDTGGASADVVWSIVIRLVVLAAATAGLCALAGGGGDRRTGFLAGWAAGVVAAGVAGAVAFAYLDATVYADIDLPGTYLDRMVAAVNNGAAYGVWTGWLIGVAVAFATRPAPELARDADVTAAWGEPVRIDDPPPPWWAPTETVGDHGEAQLRPGPSVFLPGGAPPVVAGVGERETGVMSTASGDPHPSDPDATQAVGLDRPVEEVEEKAEEGDEEGDDKGDDTSGVPDASHERAETPEREEEREDTTAVTPAAGDEPETTAVVAAADDTDPTLEGPGDG